MKWAKKIAININYVHIFLVWFTFNPKQMVICGEFVFLLFLRYSKQFANLDTLINYLLLLIWVGIRDTRIRNNKWGVIQIDLNPFSNEAVVFVFLFCSSTIIIHDRPLRVWLIMYRRLSNPNITRSTNLTHIFVFTSHFSIDATVGTANVFCARDRLQLAKSFVIEDWQSWQNVWEHSSALTH